MEEPRQLGRLGFGVFEVDLRAGELRKRGLQVRLQEQPLQVLAMLLEHPGEVVTREDLQKKLWPADTFVDFDHGLRFGLPSEIRGCVGIPSILGQTLIRNVMITRGVLLG